MSKTFRIAKDTFLGSPNDDDAKTTFGIETENAFYFGPSLAECERMRLESIDLSPIKQKGYLSAKECQRVGDELASMGLGFIFKGGK